MPSWDTRFPPPDQKPENEPEKKEPELTRDEVTNLADEIVGPASIAGDDIADIVAGIEGQEGE